MSTIKAAAVAATLALSAVATAGLASTAWAGADDGGSKAFWMTSSSGESSGVPTQAPRVQSHSAPTFRDDGYAASVSGNVYDSYRHRDRYKIQ